MKALRRWVMTLGMGLVAGGACCAQAGAPLLLQRPAVSATQVVFVYAGDLWIVGREGGSARRLTTGVGIESLPAFSPDGTQIAFTGEYDGNVDLFVMPAGGGVPRRLTYHPGPDELVGWTADGKQVLFRSGRNSHVPVPRLLTMSLDDTFATELPLPMAHEGSYSPDGRRLAYVPISQWQRAWKRYRGGQTTPIWLVNLGTLQLEKVPRENSNDFNPMWVEQRVYFLSDREGPVTLYVYDTATRKVTRVLRNDGLDIKSASAGPGVIAYEQFGSIHLLNLTSGQSKKLDIRVEADLPEVRPRFVKVGNRIRQASLSPSGARAVFAARGEILTVPAEKGDPRNLTHTTGAAERDPAWSPDGKWIAYFSDESGEYALHLRDQKGMGEVRKIGLGTPPSFFYGPTWSPDSRKIAYHDKRLNLWYVEIEKGVPVKVDTNPKPFYSFTPSWAPDSRWLAYSRQLPSHMNVVFVYDTSTGQKHQITDGLSDALYPAFDRNGKYLYFAASTDIALTIWWGNMSSLHRPVTRSAYAVVLRKDLPSPLAPESDEEKIEGEEKKEADEKADDKSAKTEDKSSEKKPEPVRIDLENIGQRIIALPIPARNYVWLTAGKAETLFLLEGAPLTADPSDTGRQTLHRFDLAKRKTEKLQEGIRGFTLSANGEKMLFEQGDQWIIANVPPPPGPGGPAPSGGPPPGGPPPSGPGRHVLKTADMEVYVDPRVEWKQMYHETWRIVRDFFYAPNLHGLDVPATSLKYALYMDRVHSREDLNYLFEEMLGELTVSHVFNGGGDQPEVKRVRGGLLGADFRRENGRYRFARVYNGENWNPQLRAPLTQPGVNVEAGEYLLAVNGREVRAADNLYRFFEGTADRSVVLKVGPNPDGTGSREVTVVPVASEGALRNLAWIEANRRKVDELSGGRVAYVYLPDTHVGGYTNFNRYYFAQVGKEGAVIDERFNGGGLIADYVIDYLRRPLMGYFTQREGDDFPTPVGSIYGPKAMIINEFAGSGGDAMPWLFRAAKIGPLIGKRTWGGLVGVSGFELMDGGFTGAPQSGFWNPNGTWDVENYGVAPDIEVELDPQSARAGRDPQLEKAVEVVLAELQKNPLPKHRKPAYPDYHRKR